MSESDITSSLLVAMPQLQDPNFRRTVALMVHHGAEGSFGLVLNRPAELSADSLCASLDLRWRGDPGETIHWGGPVEPNTGWVLFQTGDAGIEAGDDDVTEVLDDLFLGRSLEVLRAIAEEPPPDVRLFLGYAGWGSGQLERELAEGSWLVAPATSQVVFEVEAEKMWATVVRDLGVDPGTLISTRGVH